MYLIDINYVSNYIYFIYCYLQIYISTYLLYIFIYLSIYYPYINRYIDSLLSIKVSIFPHKIDLEVSSVSHTLAFSKHKTVCCKKRL